MTHHDLDLAAFLNKKGYRLTPQRQIILDSVCEANGHVTPDQVYESVHEKSAAINRATVYRTLKFLKQIQLITATILPDGQVEYELSRKKRHHHLICTNCGIDFQFADDLLIPLVELVRQRHDFDVDTNHITFTGLCHECRGGD